MADTRRQGLVGPGCFFLYVVAVVLGSAAVLLICVLALLRAGAHG